MIEHAELPTIYTVKYTSISPASTPISLLDLVDVSYIEDWLGRPLSSLERGRLQHDEASDYELAEIIMLATEKAVDLIKHGFPATDF